MSIAGLILWYFSNSSKSRVDRIIKGHGLWYIVDDTNHNAPPNESDRNIDDTKVSFSHLGSGNNPLKDLGVDLSVRYSIWVGLNPALHFV